MGRGLGKELRGHVADAAGVAEIVAHELLDRQQAIGRFDSRGRSARRSCSRTGKHVVGPPGVKVQIVAEPEQKGVGRLDGVVVFAAQRPAIAQLGEVGQAAAGEPDPAKQLQIAERALRRLMLGSRRKTVSP